MRASGILAHITSLPSDYGIGTLGKAAYEFVDFLKQAGQKYWQILPVSPTSYGDSPYQSFSTFAGNPYFIDLDALAERGLLLPEEYRTLDWGNREDAVDYGQIYQTRFVVLKKAYHRFLQSGASPEYDEFKGKQAFWLDDYALYMAIKVDHGNRSWAEWETPLRFREGRALGGCKRRLASEIEFWRFLQYEFFQQWFALKEYANQNGVSIIGDIPIYVALDSADVWGNPELFVLDEDLSPVEVAGCPPDYFSATGQLWGNPIYNWDVMEKTGYAWWINRISAAVSIYDTVRIDHFRGFESFYAIPAGDTTAENGVWRKGPGMDLFDRVNERLGGAPIIAEDLGLITEAVRMLLNESGYPGMKVLEFAFTAGQDSDYLPHHYEKNCICYTGTHDNETLTGWLEALNETDRDYVMRYTRTEESEPALAKAKCVENLIALAWASTADIAVVQLQDLLGLGSEARMNIPSTVGSNWQWRLKRGQLDDALARRVAGLTELYWR